MMFVVPEATIIRSFAAKFTHAKGNCGASRLSVLKADKKAIFTAVSKASEAAAFLDALQAACATPALSGRARPRAC
jgi:antirestriction protein ArdC